MLSLILAFTIVVLTAILAVAVCTFPIFFVNSIKYDFFTATYLFINKLNTFLNKNFYKKINILNFLLIFHILIMLAFLVPVLIFADAFSFELFSKFTELGIYNKFFGQINREDSNKIILISILSIVPLKYSLLMCLNSRILRNDTLPIKKIYKF